MTLDEYIKRHVENLADFSRELGYENPKSIYRVLSGTRGISPEKIKRVHEVTKGKVTANDFYGAS